MRTIILFLLLIFTGVQASSQVSLNATPSQVIKYMENKPDKTFREGDHFVQVYEYAHSRVVYFFKDNISFEVYIIPLQSQFYEDLLDYYRTLPKYTTNSWVDFTTNNYPVIVEQFYDEYEPISGFFFKYRLFNPRKDETFRKDN